MNGIAMQIESTYAAQDMGQQIRELRDALSASQARVRHMQSEVAIAVGELEGDIDQTAIESATGVVIPAIDRVISRLTDILPAPPAETGVR